jgi:hypothetical protein
MILKLTNNNITQKGKPILINMEHIISVYEDTIDDTPVTVLYSNTNQSWYVMEKINFIFNLIRKNNTTKNENV